MAVPLVSVVAVAISIATAPAAASSSVVDESTIELSVDGLTWSTTPPDSLFPVDLRIVPGDDLSSKLYVRSSRDAPSALTIVVSNVVVDNSYYGDDLLLSGRDNRAMGLSGQRLSSIDSCVEVVPSRVVARGEVVPVTLSVQLPIGSENQTQHSIARFWIQVGLSDDISGGRDPFGCPKDPIIIPALPSPTEPSPNPHPTNPEVQQPDHNEAGARVIAMTGSELFYPALAIAGGAIGVGLFLLGARRRRRGSE